MRTSRLLVSFLGVVSLGVIACGSTPTPGADGDGNVDVDSGATITPPSGDAGSPPSTTTPDAGQTAAADAGQTTVPPACDPTKTPSQDACVVIEALGIFVMPPGAATTDAGAALADGTRARPFTKLQDGIDAARLQKKRVYACAADYAEQITLADGVSMFGDLDCKNDWAVVATHASVKAPASPAAVANGITTPTRVEEFDLIAPDGTATAPTSIGLLATNASALTFAQSTIHAGKGANGADGVAGIQLSNGTVDGADGLPQHKVIYSLPLCSSQPPTINTCVGAPGFQGGAGGAGGWGGHWLIKHESSVPAAYAPPPTQTCLASHPCVCINGLGGSQPATTTTAQGGAYVLGTSNVAVAMAGQRGASGQTGASGVAALSADGGLHFIPGDGLVGTNGAPGQGGGGGAGVPVNSPDLAENQEIIGYSGASGGAGGCPGLAGTPGKGGGASIAILTDSAFTLDTCNVQASDGGNGGKGAFPSSPTSGGAPGSNPFPSIGYTAGQYGGAGGQGGASGSGAGGASIGIAVSGTSMPKLVSTTPIVGAQGHGVAASTSGTATLAASDDGKGAATVTF